MKMFEVSEFRLMDTIHRSCAFALAIGLLWGAHPAAFAQQPDMRAPAFDVAAQETFRRFGDEFIAAAVAGDTARMVRMIGPAIVANTGQEAVERYLADRVVPFFTQFKEIGKSVTVTRTADTPGFVFYMYMMSKADELRPFAIFVIEENGVQAVANVSVDEFVESRHCVLSAGMWRCPDMR
ncbi:MAG: hypothetical protein ACREC6_14050 [Hyphomicrobiaceae bacterium]